MELEEGSNLEHTLDIIRKEDVKRKKDDDGKNKKNNKLDKDVIDMDSIEIYYTRSGRPVLGGGGITPDYVIKYDTTRATELFVKLRNQGAFQELKERFVSETKEKFKNDFNKFNNEFSFTDKMVKELKKIAKEKDIE